MVGKGKKTFNLPKEENSPFWFKIICFPLTIG